VELTVDIRPLRAEDEPELVRIAADAMREQAEASGEQVLTGRALATMERDVVFVAECEGHLAGYVALRPQAATLVVEHLAVSELDQGHGVAHRLLDWAEGYGVSEGMHAVRIRVEPDNVRALEFYERRGYRPAAGDGVERELLH
jgi:tRNA threonylcarbamoyladenosine biosynthesis protein TsaE